MALIEKSLMLLPIGIKRLIRLLWRSLVPLPPDEYGCVKYTLVSEYFSMEAIYPSFPDYHNEEQLIVINHVYIGITRV